MRYDRCAPRRYDRWVWSLVWLILAVALAWSGRAGAETEAEIEARMAETEAELDARSEELEALAEEIEARTGEGQARDHEVELRLEEAQRQMEEAAREVAELSARISGDAVELAMRSLDIRRAMLGINIGTTPESGNQGVLVMGVTPDGPADRAGLRSGDLITMIDGVDLTGGEPGDGLHRLERRMKNVAAGDELALTVKRGDAVIDFVVAPEETNPLIMAFGLDGSDWGREFEKLKELEALEDFELHADGPHGFAFRFGPGSRWGDMELVVLTPELGDYFGADEGLLVVRAPSEPGLGLRDGDVILAIDGRKPTDPGHAMRILRSYEPGETLRFDIMRQRGRQAVEVVVPDAEVDAARTAPPEGPGAGTGAAASGLDS
jgi:C-terminal processing protease CtpA/Prc